MNSKWELVWGGEWDYVKKLGAAIVDPGDKRDFWENIKRLKTENPRLSIYDLFPRSESANKKAMKECCEFVKSLRKLKEEESA